jgi:hypothetical protein
MQGSDVGRLLEYVEFVALKINYFEVDFSAHSRRESYMEQVNKFCDAINRLQWKTRSASSKGIIPRPAMMNVLLSLLGRIGPTTSLMDALDRFVYHSAAISALNICMALKYSVVLDAISNADTEAFIQRHNILFSNTIFPFSSFLFPLTAYFHSLKSRRQVMLSS